jgi:hypothetical protein
MQQLQGNDCGWRRYSTGVVYVTDITELVPPI